MKNLASILLALLTLSQLAFGSLIRPEVSPKYGSSVTLVADSSMYQNTKLVTGIAAEIAITVGTGGLGTVGKLGTLGKVVRAYDMLGSGVSMGRGAYGYSQGDFSFNNTLSLLGGIAGFGSNLAGMKNFKGVQAKKGVRNVQGLRQQPGRMLNDDEIAFIRAEFEAIGGNPSILRFNIGRSTSYVDEADIINIRGDILPNMNYNHPRSTMSVRAVLAHELGHRQVNLQSLANYGHITRTKPGSWNDEFRASYLAIKRQGLSEADRIDLLNDAMARAREANVQIKPNKQMQKWMFQGFE